MDDKNTSTQTSSTPVITPQNDGTVQYAAASPVVSSQPVAPLAAEQGVQSPINLAYESLDGPDENSTQASTSIVASSTATQNVAAQPTQTPAPKKQTLGFRDKDTSKLLTRVIAGALVVILLLFSGTMISSRISNNRAVEPVSQLDEQEVVSLQGSGTPLDVKTNGSTLLVNGSVLATQSLQVTNGSANATIVFAGVNEDRTYTLPNAAGVFCLDTNNCGYLQAEDITTTSVAGVDGALTLGSGLAINGSEISNTITQTSVNNSTGSIIIQGTTNQVGLSKNGNTITLTSPQDIGQTSSPTFNSITLSGVGTQNGNVLCDISNNCGYAGGTGAYIQDGNSFGETAVLGTNDAFDLAFETNGVTRIVVDTSGNTTVSGQILSANAGTTANPAFSFLFDEDTGLYRAADNTVGISTGGANNTTFSTSGVDIQGRVTIGDAAGAPGAAAGLLVQETFTAADSFCTFGCYGAQIIAIADNPLANNGIAALAVQAQTAATAFVQTNATGLFVGNTAAGAGSTINNGYGIRVNDQTGATNNYGIAIGTANTQALWIGNTADSTTASNGIGFGISRDTNLYRSAADTLRTDDTFISGTRIGINTSTFGTNNRLTVNANTTTDNLAALQINTGATTNKGLVIQRSAGQTANLQEWQSSTGSVLTYIDASGFLNSPRFKENTNGVVIGGAASPEAGTNVLVESTGASNKALVVKGFTGQTANLQEWQSSTGTALTTVTSSGEMRFYSDATNYAAIAAQTGGSLLINTVTGGSITIVPDSNLNLGTVNTGQILMGRTGTDIPIALRGTTTLSVVSASSRPLTIRGAAGQTANLTEWQNSSSTVLGSIGATGAVLFQNSTNSTNALRVLNAAGTTTVLNVDTTNGRVGIGNAAPTAELDVTGDTVVSNRLQVGPTGNTIGQCATIFGPISCDVALDIANASTETAIGTHGIYNNVSINPGSANSASNYASYNTITTQGANSFSGTATTGVYGATIIGNTAGTIARAVGVEGNAGIFTTTSTTVVSEAIGVLAGTGVISTVSGGTVTNNYGMYVSAANITGAGASITNNYGLYVNPQTAGGSDYGIAVGAADTQTLWLSSNADNTTAAAGIAFGLSRDTNLYRSAANTLRTDDALSVGDDITVTGDILPSADDTYDLGSNSNRWRDLYLGPATLSIGTSSADYKISYDTGGNSLLLNNDQADRDFRIAGVTQANLLYVDAGNNRVGIGTNTPGYELDVVGTLNASTGINVNGTQVCTSSGCTAASGSTSYIQNGTSVQTNTNLAIQSAAAGSIGAVIRGAASQTASLQEWQNSSGTVLANVLANGTFALGTTNVGALLNLRSATTPTGTPTEAAATIRLNTVFNDLGSGNNSTGAIEFGNSSVRTWRSDNNLRIAAYDGVTIDTAAANTAAVSLKVRAVASQTGNLQEWQNSSGTAQLRVTSAGVLENSSTLVLQNGNGGNIRIGTATDNLSHASGQISVRSTTLSSQIAFSTSGGTTGGDGFRVVGSELNTGDLVISSSRNFFQQDTYERIRLVHGDTAGGAFQIRAVSGTSANLQEWLDSAGATLASVSSAGVLQFGSASDVSLYRSSADLLRTDDSLTVGGSTLRVATASGGLVYISNTLALESVGTTLRVGEGYVGGVVLRNNSSTAPLIFGTAADTNLYRSAANTLTTDGSLRVQGGGPADTSIVIGNSGNPSRLNLGYNSAYGSITSNGNIIMSVDQDNNTASGDYFSWGFNGTSSTYTEAMRLNDSGQFGLNTSSFGTNNKLTVNANNTVDNAAAAQINSNATGRKGLVVQGFSGQTANLQEWQSSTGTALLSVGATGLIGSNATGTEHDFGATPGARIGSYLRFGGGSGGASSGVIRMFNSSVVNWRNAANTGNIGITVNASDTLQLGAAATTLDTVSDTTIGTSATTRKGLVIQGLASQTANLQEWQSSTGTVLASISSAGNLTVVNATVNGTLVVNGASTFNGNITVNGQIITGNASGSTTVTVDTAGAGTGASASISGNDTSGVITINTGTGAAAGKLATITFSAAFPSSPNVVITPKAIPGGGAYPQYHYDSAAGTFDLSSFNALTDGSTYTFSYFIVD